MDTHHSKLTTIQEFLGSALAHVTTGIRSGHDFLQTFPARVLMEKVYPNKTVREAVLTSAVQMNPVIAGKISLASASESLEIALTEQLTEPSTLINIIGPLNLVRHLDNQKLWSWITEPVFWETKEPEPLQRAKKCFAAIIETGLHSSLLTAGELIRSIGFTTVFINEPKESVIAALALFADQSQEQAFKTLLQQHGPTRLVETVPLQTIWTQVIRPLIAERHGLMPNETKGDSVQVKPPPYPPPSSPGPGLHASTIPPALRVSGSQTQKAPEVAIPKDNESPRDETHEDEQTVSRFTPTELLQDAEPSGATAEATIASPPPIETPRPPPSRLTGPPQAPRPPRPRRITQTDVATIEVGEGTMSERELLDEPGDDPEEKYGPAYIPEAQFRTAGGGIASDPMPWSSEGSLAISGKAALCGLLRSVGLKLPKVDPLSSETYEMIVQALQEIDPEIYTDELRERFTKNDLESLKQRLLKEVRNRFLRNDTIRLLEIFDGLEAPPEQRASPSGAKRPPPLPPKSSPAHASVPAPSFTAPAPANKR